MASNEINIAFRVVQDGSSFKLIAGEATTAAKATDNLASSTERLNGSQAKQYRQSQGVAQNTSNSTKAFAKQAQSIGGTLVPAYATLAANVFAVTAAFGALRRAAAVEQLAAGLEYAGVASGQNLPKIAENLREVTGQAISASAAMEQVALATSSGFSADEIERLGVVARGAAQALGRDMEDALNRVVRGTSKLEPELLDELGIRVRLDDAVAKYALTLGKTSAQLTQAERSQAFLNEVIDQGTKKFGDIAKAIDPNAYDQLAASFEKLSKTFLNVVNTVLGPTINFLADNTLALSAATVLFGSSIARDLLPVMGDYAERAANLAEDTDLLNDKMNKSALTASDLGNASKRVGQTFLDSAQGAEDYQTAISDLDRQYNTLNAQVQRSIENNNLEGEALDKQKAKLRANRAAREQLIASQKSSNAVRLQTVKYAALESAASLDVKESYRFLNTAINQYRMSQIAAGASTTGLIGLWTRAKVAAFAFSLSIRAIGTALLAAVPIIGQILAVGSLLYEGWKYIFPDNEVDKRAKNVAGSIEFVAKVLDDLNSKIIENKLANGEISFEGIRQLANAGKGLVVDFNKTLDAILAAPATQTEAAERTIASRLLQIEELRKKTGEYNETAQYTIAGLQQEILDAQAIINNPSLIDINWTPLLNQVRAAKKELSGFPITLSGAEAAFAKLEEALTSGKPIDPVFLREWIATIGAAEAKTYTTEQAVKDSLDGMNQALQKLKQTKADPFRDLNDSAGRLIARLEEVSDDKLKELQKEFPKLAQAMGTTVEQARKYAENVQRLYQIHLTLNEQLETQKALQEQLTKTSSFSVSSLGRQLEVENEIKDNAIARLQNQKNAINLQTASKEELQRIKEIEAEISKIQASKTTESERSLQLKKLEVSQTMQLLDFQSKALNSERELLSARMSSAKAQKEIANFYALGTTRLGPSSELAQFEEFKAQRISLLNQEASVRQALINAEYDLILFELSIQKGMLADNLAEVARITELEGTVQNAKEAALSASAAQVENGVILIEREGVALKEAIIQGGRQAAQEVQNIIKEMDKLNSDTRLANINARFLEKAAKNYEDGVTKTARLTAAQEIEKTIEIAAEKMKAAQREAELETKAIEMRVALMKERWAQLEAEKGIVEAQKGITIGVDIPDGSSLSQIASDYTTSLMDNVSAKQREIAAQTGVDIKNTLEEQRQAMIAASGTGATTADRISNFSTETDGAGLDALGTTEQKLKAIDNLIQPMKDNLAALGPEGEFVNAIVEGSMSAANAWSTAFDTINSASAKSHEKTGAVLSAIGASFEAIGNMMNAQSQARISQVDKEIEAEKKRDGKSKDSLAKISALEKKKEKLARKQFEMNKKMQIASAIANTASAVVGALGAQPWTPANIGLAALIGAMGAAQVAIISGTTFQGGGDSSGGSSLSSFSMGERSSSVDLAKSTAPAGELSYLRGAQGTGSINDFTPAFTGMKYRAGGGETTGFVVGEQGPELFVPEKPGKIVPNDEAMAGSSVNATINIQALDADGVEDVLRRQRGNIIGMIREAANSHGETFLESVSTMDK